MAVATKHLLELWSSWERDIEKEISHLPYENKRWVFEELSAIRRHHADPYEAKEKVRRVIEKAHKVNMTRQYPNDPWQQMNELQGMFPSPAEMNRMMNAQTMNAQQNMGMQNALTLNPAAMTGGTSINRKKLLLLKGK